MKAKIIYLILFCSICHIGFAQTFTADGVIIDSNSHQPVPFATLGVRGKNIGTVADENGVFRFVIDEVSLSPEEQILISSIGYQQISISLSKFKQGRFTINLMPVSNTLKEVTIKPDKFKSKTFGRTGNSTIMTANMFTERNLVNDNLGKEQAAILPIDEHCFIKDFNMLVVFNRFQSVKFRLNFYSVKNGLPDKLIVDKDILFDVTQKNGWVNIDLTKYNIYLDGYNEVAVAIQWVKSVKIDTIAKSAFGVSVTPVPFHTMFFRNKSQAEWEKHSTAYVAFNITADSFKPNKESKEAPQNSETIELSDSIKNYIAYTHFANEATASGYGNNSKVGKYVHLIDADIYCEIYGSGEPLLLLHGNNASISSFYKQIPVLAKSYQVIAVDTRGQGKSTDKTTIPLSYEKFAEDMEALLDSLHIKQANIIGWSDGGNIGLIMASKYPSSIKKLITIGAVLSPDGIEQSLLDKLRAGSNKNNVKDQNQLNVNQRLLALLINEPHITGEDLKQIQAEVLVVAGEKDVVKREHTQGIADSIKRSKLLIIKDATHYAPQEKPLEFNKIALQFLK
jgi:pimeloyl-ACP methyl ester carboxylesterase